MHLLFIDSSLTSCSCWSCRSKYHSIFRLVIDKSRIDLMTIRRTKLWCIITLIFWSISVANILQHPLSTLLFLGWRFYLGLLTLSIGLASGILLVVHPRSGKILAISLSAMLIVWRLWYYASSFSQIGDRLYALYIIHMGEHPFKVIYFDILSYVFYVSTIYSLSKKEPVAD